MTFKGPPQPKTFSASLALQRVALLKRYSLKGDPNPSAPHHITDEGRVSPENGNHIGNHMACQNHRKQCAKEKIASQGIEKLKRIFSGGKRKASPSWFHYSCNQQKSKSKIHLWREQSWNLYPTDIIKGPPSMKQKQRDGKLTSLYMRKYTENGQCASFWGGGHRFLIWQHGSKKV